MIGKSEFQIQTIVQSPRPSSKMETKQKNHCEPFEIKIDRKKKLSPNSFPHKLYFILSIIYKKGANFFWQIFHSWK